MKNRKISGEGWNLLSFRLHWCGESTKGYRKALNHTASVSSKTNLMLLSEHFMLLLDKLWSKQVTVHSMCTKTCQVIHKKLQLHVLRMEAGLPCVKNWSSHKATFQSSLHEWQLGAYSRGPFFCRVLEPTALATLNGHGSAQKWLLDGRGTVLNEKFWSSPSACNLAVLQLWYYFEENKNICSNMFSVGRCTADTTYQIFKPRVA